jgi:lysyl-tRNA synthetase class 1
MAPKENTEGFIEEKLRSYGYLRKDQHTAEFLRRRIEYAFNWIRDFEEIKEAQTSLSGEEKAAISALAKVLEAETEPEKIQNAIFSSAKDSGLKPGEFFRALYMILIGGPQGPRLGPYILAMGKQNVLAALNRALEKN